MPNIAIAHTNGDEEPWLYPDGEIDGTPVHQYIAWQALDAFSEAPQELRSHIKATNVIDLYSSIDGMCTAQFASGDDVISGSAEEDQERNPLFCGPLDENCTGDDRLNGFYEHFWDPDKPLYGVFNCTPDSGGYNHGLSDENKILPGSPVKKTNEEEYWDSSYRVAQYYWDEKVIPDYIKGYKDVAYYWLGRVTHLLTDATVPAHVHNDVHALGYGDDSFEKFAANMEELNKYKGAYYKDDTYKYEELEKKISSINPDFKWGNVYDQDNPPNLFRLFWYTAQKTQYFASDNADGDGGKFTSVNGEYQGKSFGKPGLWEEKELLPGYGIIDDSWIVENYLIPITFALIPHSIKAVAGLYRLFWVETQVGKGAPHSLRPKFLKTYLGPSMMGFPVNDVHLWGEYWVQDFPEMPDFGRSIMIYNPKLDKVFIVHGEIWEQVYEPMGGVNSSLGLPISNEEPYPVSDSLSNVIQRFENGYITHFPDSDSYWQAYEYDAIVLPRTGQTNCYDSSGLITNCYSTGQDGDIRAGVPWPEPRFDFSGDCVTDNLTGLMWTKNANLLNGSMDWQGSLNFANSLSLCGYTDWRLPNINELESLTNYGKARSHAWLLDQGFRNVQGGYYWSSTLSGSPVGPEWCADTLVWVVDMHMNSVHTSGMDNYPRYAWPVRDGGGLPSTVKLPKTGQTVSCGAGDDGDLQLGVAWPEPRFVVSGGCVIDNLTGLTWAKNADLLGGAENWQEALSYANGLSLCGYDDWRIPNIKELRSLLKYGSPPYMWLSEQGFLNVQNQWTGSPQSYWSSTTSYNYLSSEECQFGGCNQPWCVGMGSGSFFFTPSHSDNIYLWPVRGGSTCPAPGTPSSPSPPDGATGVSIPTTLSWAPCSHANSYDVYFGTSSNPPYVTNTTSTSYTVLIPSATNTYYWRIVAKNNCGNATSGPVWRFTVCPDPGTPTLINPSNGATGISVTPALDWSDISGATSYDFQVCNDSGCSSVVRSANITISQWIVTPALDSGETYYWRTRANNSCGSGSWSSSWSFTTLGIESVSTPAQPSGLADGGARISYTYSTGGSTSNFGDSVEYQFDWKGDGTTDLSPWDSATQSKTWNNTGTYNVRARARCTIHTNVVSSWSSSLPVIITLPEAATLISPSGTITTTTPTYTWNAVPGVTGYYLWVNDSTGNKIKQGYTPSAAGCPSGTGTCSVTPSTALAAGEGTWWILTYNSEGVGPWSTGMNFIVSHPGQAKLISPSGAIIDTTPAYVWNAASGSTWYHLYVNDTTGNKIDQWYAADACGCACGTGTCSATPITEVIGSCKWYIQT